MNIINRINDYLTPERGLKAIYALFLLSAIKTVLFEDMFEDVFSILVLLLFGFLWLTFRNLVVIQKGYKHMDIFFLMVILLYASRVIANFLELDPNLLDFISSRFMGIAGTLIYFLFAIFFIRLPDNFYGKRNHFALGLLGFEVSIIIRILISGSETGSLAEDPFGLNMFFTILNVGFGLFMFISFGQIFYRASQDTSTKSSENIEGLIEEIGGKK